MRKLGTLISVLAFILISTSGASQSLDTQMQDVLKTEKEVLIAQRRTRSKSKKSTRKRTTTRKTSRSDLVEALKLAKGGKYMEASIKLFQLSQSPRYRDKRVQIKYILGLMLYQMKMNQVSAFQFISVIRKGNSRYLKQSLEKLSLAADALGDDTLLNYAISRVKVDDFPRVHRDMLYFRIGEFQLRNKQFRSAAKSFGRVQRSHFLFPKAKYQQGLALTESKQLKSAVNTFDDLIDSRASGGVTDSARVAGLMGKARVLYQRKRWNDAIEMYREIPRDTELWHDTLFESSWAMLRSGRFRSALSNFHSLHSAYYEDFYLPESLLLRSIVYLYICNYQEMDKVLNLFNRIYNPVFKDISAFLDQVKDPKEYFAEMVKVMKEYKSKGDDMNRSKFLLPFLVVRHISREGDFRGSFNYIKKLLEERKRAKAMPAAWRDSAIGRYSVKVIQTRLIKARDRAGRQVKAHLESLREDMFDLFEQEGFIRFEMINGKKEAIKKRMAGKTLPKTQVDQNRNRDYYIQNGYEYWKFQGEYWLDELGNYHYVGTQSCR